MMERCIENAESHCKSYPRCYGCNMFREPTNADRIRAMSDEELAVFLLCFGCCHYCTENERLGNEARFLLGEKCDEQCEQHLTEWLKQPAQEEL